MSKSHVDFSELAVAGQNLLYKQYIVARMWSCIGVRFLGISTLSLREDPGDCLASFARLQVEQRYLRAASGVELHLMIFLDLDASYTR